MPKRKHVPERRILYDVFCGILYILKGDIQWRMLPSDFPNRKLVYYYFKVWFVQDDAGISLPDRVLKKLTSMFRNEFLKKDDPSLGIIDAKSIKNVDTAREKGYDGGKKFPESSCTLLWIPCAFPMRSMSAVQIPPTVMERLK